jgi:hypothetical protein
VVEYLRQQELAQNQQFEQWQDKASRGPVPGYIASAPADCRRFREAIALRGNSLWGQALWEARQRFRQVMTTADPHTLQELPDMDRLLREKGRGRKGRNWGWNEDGPFHAWLDAQTVWFTGDEEETVFSGMDEFLPTQSRYRYFIKWDGKGWYAAMAEPLYGYSANVKIQIQLDTYFVQAPYPDVITVRKVPWSILHIDSNRFKESNFLGGFEFFETSVSLYPNEYVLIMQELRLYVSSMNNAFAILDFRGWEDDPYWINFGVFGIPE